MRFLWMLLIFGLPLNQACGQDQRILEIVEREKEFLQKTESMDDYEQITFGAGCFWCVEAVFQELKGVKAAVSGYAGGHVKNPTYREVVSGRTGHAEVVKVTFDPDVIPLQTVLEVFWSTHDPTTLNRQGADVGTQYRSAVFYNSKEQRKIAQKSKDEVATELWDDPIVTEITPLETFYQAEEYHQNYYANNPEQGYCRVVINPKLNKFRERFKDWLK
ncbi:MAG: peptide-methionine (S)-S-oxide reductase [Saprospirales bacterium]|nr:MAG: peptide-methionine (S)-S-oxide reductase [Saprospirales bacterium]